MTVYFISGMGADQRAFSFITLPEGFSPVYIQWIPPQSGDTLSGYALRLTDQIDTTRPFVLIGLSMGGMMSVEIAKKFQPVATILISSISLSGQLPSWYRWIAALKLGFLANPKLLKAVTRCIQVLPVKLSPARRLTYNMLLTTDNSFFKWALAAVPGWHNNQLPYPLYHIHGTKDKVLPISLTHPTESVPQAGHILVMSHPAVVNAFLAKTLQILREAQ